MGEKKVLVSAHQPPSSIVEPDIIPLSLTNGTDERSTFSRRSSSSESIEDAPVDEAVFNMYRVNVPHFVSNYDCNPVTSIQSTDELVHIFQCTADKSFDEDERAFWSQFNPTDGGKSTVRGPPPIASQQHDCDIHNLCVSIFDYLFGGGDSAYNQVNRSQSVGNVPPFHPAEQQQRKVHPRNPYPGTTTTEPIAFEVTFSEIEDIAKEHTFTRIERRRKWPFSKQSKTQPEPNEIDNAQVKSDDFSKKFTIIETEGDTTSTLVDVPKVIYTSSQRPSQKSSTIISEAADSLVATTRLDDKDNCYNQVLDNYAVVTPEKPTAMESNAIVGEEHTYPPKPILRSTSAKNRHLLLALKLTPEKAFHLNNNIPDEKLSSSSHLVTQNYSSGHHSDPVMTSQDQQPFQVESLRYLLPSKAEDENDLIIRHEQLKELYKSGVILDDLREEQKKYSVNLEGDAVTIPSSVTALSSAHRQEYSSSLSGTEEDTNQPFTQIKKDSLEYKVKKVLLMYVEKQEPSETSGLLDKSFMINEESTMGEKSNEEYFNISTPSMGFYDTASQPKTTFLYQDISDSNKGKLLPSASGLTKNQPSLINFVLKPPSEDSYAFNYTRAANYRQTLADRDEYSRQKGFHTVEKVKNRSIVVADNDTASSPHSSQNSCESRISSKQNEIFVHSTGNTSINNSLSGYAVKQKGITFPTIRIKPLAENLDGNPIIISAPFAVLSKPSATEQKPIISNDDLYFVTSTQNSGKSYDSGGDESTVETSNVTSLKKNNKITIHRLKNVPPLSAIFGRSSIIPFSALEDDDCSEQEAISLPEGINAPLEKGLFSESTSPHGDLSMAKVGDNDFITKPVQEGYLQGNTESLVSDRQGEIPDKKYANQILTLEPNIPQVTAHESLNGMNRALHMPKNTSCENQANVPEMTATERLNENSSPTQSEITERRLFSESSSLHRAFSMEKVVDNDSNSEPFQEGYLHENTESIVSDSLGDRSGKKYAKQNLSLEPNTPQVTDAERLNVNPRSLPKPREISDGEQSVSRKVMIEACDMSIISEMSAVSKSISSKNENKVKTATNLKKKNPESQLELFFSANKENDPSNINATQSVRTGSYSVATERSKIHSRFVDETKGKGWVATMKIASSGEWKPNGGWIDMNDELYRKCFAEDLNVGIHSRSSQRQSKKKTEKEQLTHFTGNALTKAVPASATGYTLATSIKGSSSQDHDPSQQNCHTSAPNRCLEVTTTPVGTTDFETKVDAQDPITPHQDKKIMHHNFQNNRSYEAVTENVSNTPLAVDVSARRRPFSSLTSEEKLRSVGTESVSIGEEHKSSLPMENCNVQLQEKFDFSAKKPVWFNVKSQFPPPPPPPPPTSRLPKRNQMLFEHAKKNSTQEEIDGDDLVFAASSAEVFSPTDIKISDPQPEFNNETVGFGTVSSHESTENSRKIDESSNGNRSVASNLIDLVKCGVRGELPSANLDFLRRGKESNESQQHSRSRFHGFTSAMFSCGSNKAFLNTIQEDDEETKEDTEAEADVLRYQHFQGRILNQAPDEESETSRDTLSQFLNDEMKEPHRLARVRLERLAAKRVDTMINSSFLKNSSTYIK
jgi:hypothetical protein